MLPGELFELSSCSVWLDERERNGDGVWTALYMWTESGHCLETDLSDISVRSRDPPGTHVAWHPDQSQTASHSGFERCEYIGGYGAACIVRL
jgi:hypothetical protein